LKQVLKRTKNKYNVEEFINILPIQLSEQDKRRLAYELNESWRKTINLNENAFLDRPTFLRFTYLSDFISQILSHEHLILYFYALKSELPELNKYDIGKIMSFLTILNNTFDIFQPICMWAGRDADIQRDIGEVLHQLPHKKIYGAVYYGLDMVELIGREKLLLAPVYKIDKRPWGGIILQLEENPWDLEDKKLPGRIEKHLGLSKLDFSKISPPLKEWQQYDESDFDDIGNLLPESKRNKKKEEKTKRKKPWE